MKTMLSNHNAKRPWRAGLGLAAVLAGCGGGVGGVVVEPAVVQRGRVGAGVGGRELRARAVLDPGVDGGGAGLRAGQVGQGVVDVAGGVPNVTAVTADTDEVFGYVSKNFRKDATAIGDVVEIALGGCVMFMIAGAAVASGADLMYVTATGKVITATGATKVVSGYALDKAAADGDLIRVYIKSAVDKSGVLGFSGTVTFYAAATSGGAVTVLNTIIYLNGKVLSHTQA